MFYTVGCASTLAALSVRFMQVQVLLLCTGVWVLRPMFGMLSDTLPLCGYHRTSYVCVYTACATLSHLAAALAASDDMPAAAAHSVLPWCLVANSVTLCALLTVLDALLVEVVSRESAAVYGSALSACWLCRGAGMLSGAAFAGFGAVTEPLTNAMPAFMYTTSALFLLSLACFACTCRHLEDTAHARLRMDSTLRLVRSWLGDVRVLRSSLFVLGYAAQPVYYPVLLQYERDVLGMSVVQFSSLSVGSHVGMLTGIWVLGRCLGHQHDFARIMCVCIVAAACFSAANIVALASPWLLVALEAARSFCASLALAVVMLQCMSFIPRDAGGVCYAVLSSLLHLGYLTGVSLGVSLAASFTSSLRSATVTVALLVLVCSTLQATVPLALLWCCFSTSAAANVKPANKAYSLTDDDDQDDDRDQDDDDNERPPPPDE